MSFLNKSNLNVVEVRIGRNLCPIFVQFRCPRSPTTFSPYDSMDFYVLNSNFNVVTSKNLQFFCNLRSKIDLFPWKLHVIYNYCTSPSLLAGGFLADTGIFVLF